MEYGLKPLGREKLWTWGLLAPTLIGLVFGAIGSLLATLVLSLFDWDLISSPKWAGLANYVALFENSNYVKAFTNTIVFAGLYVPGAMGVFERSIYTDFIYLGGPKSFIGEMVALTPCAS